MATADTTSGDRDTPLIGADEDSCVEVTVISNATGVAPHKADAEVLYVMRDTRNPGGPELHFTRAEWDAFVLGVKDGEFDLSTWPVTAD